MPAKPNDENLYPNEVNEVAVNVLEAVGQMCRDTFELHDDKTSASGKPSLTEIGRRLEQQFNLGLKNRECQATSDCKMYPTFVETLPTGKEIGDYLAVDVGGTWFRVLFFQMDGSGTIAYSAAPLVKQIPQSIMLGHVDKLFDFIVETVDQFVVMLIEKDHLRTNPKPDLPLGFSFSFPFDQEAIDQGILMNWTKGFACEGAIGRDVVEMLHEARDRKLANAPFTFHCACLINDTVGCLTSTALTWPNCRAGVIFGTGTNAAYPEKLSNIGTLPKAFKPQLGSTHMVVNTDWGSFGTFSEALADLQSDADRALDVASLNKGCYIFEKMISGMYLGEVLRLFLIGLIEKKYLLLGVNLIESGLLESHKIQAKYLSDIENDPDPHSQVRKMLQEINIKPDLITSLDCEVILAASIAISGRASKLAAVAMATVLKRIDPAPENIVIGVHGSLVRFHKAFERGLTEKTRSLLDQWGYGYVKFSIEHAEDGSGLGPAALAAAISQAK